jgi:predicted transcriptional regulator
LGEQIKKRRLQLGLSQKVVGKMLGVTSFTILNWEKGKTEPRCVSNWCRESTFFRGAIALFIQCSLKQVQLRWQADRFQTISLHAIRLISA